MFILSRCWQYTVTIRCNLWFEEEVIQSERGSHGSTVMPQEGEERVPLSGITQEVQMCPMEDRQAEARTVKNVAFAE